MTSPADEAPQGEGDAITLSFADALAGWYALARLGDDSELAVLFRDGEVAAVGGEGLRMDTRAPLEAWTAAWDGADAGFEVEVTAVAAPVERAGRLAGYEQLVRVMGTVRAGGETVAIDGVGQRGHTWGVADWSSLELVRTVAAWLGDGGIVLEAERPARAEHHSDEQVWAALVERGEPVPIFDPRLSTTYDGDGHQRRAGLELWTTEEEGYPFRAAGEVICGSSLDLGELQLDLAFFRWHAHGALGVGRYDILRKR